ncbi:MAG: penicillin acylase family protein [Imperialibacter sp.]|uniref:penicillin acylase family protein n=1 Tax=Imperialibacter sp. TaxID=2038411 RepID=UPI0030DCD9A6|tara:strand:- start:18261 stop:20660 length:2400 start_codon:yes stop_codon:yes gene_type:complete
MKTIKRLLKGILVLIILLVISLYFYLQHIKPKYKGDLTLSPLENKVEVWFDSYGIPHIYAENKSDLYLAMGYLHAQERLFQMELVRRIAPGRLSEILGKDLLPTDKFFRTLGIHLSSQEAAKKLRAQTNNPTLKEAEAYLRGINEFLEKGPTPLEYELLGIEKTPFTLEDIYNAVGYMSFSFAAAHKTDPLVSFINAELGASYLKDLGLKADTTRQMIPSYFGDPIGLNEKSSAKLLEMLNQLPVSPFIGSNGWVLGPSKTKSGKVLFANDPHIGFSQPSVWYEAYLETPDFQLYGYHLAGYPFAILGHNRQVAVGLTMLENDDVDFFRETKNEADSNQYLYKGEWKSFDYRDEIIKVKDEEDIVFQVKTSLHGPVVNGMLGEIVGPDPVAMWWTYNKLPNQVLDATRKLNNAQSPGDVTDALKLIHAPGLNVMYGDAKGNVAWWATARLIKRPEHVNSFTILNGSTGEDDPLGYFDFAENPHSVNPPMGYVFSANNQPDSVNGYYYPGYYLPEDRARRIKQLIDSKNDWDSEDVKKMLMDETSPAVVQNIGVLLTAMENASLLGNDQKALELLRAWDGKFGGQSAAPIIYTRWLYTILEKAMKDELGQDKFDLFMSTTDLRKRTFPLLIANDSSSWWYNADKKTVEPRQDVIYGALISAVASLEDDLGRNVDKWRWENIHTLTHNHALGVVPLLGKVLNVGDFHVSSGEEVINNWGYPVTSENKYRVSFGPSTRRVVDFSDIENSESILPTGQSGVFHSRHYDDQAQMYVEGKFRKMAINKKELTTSGKLLMLLPDKE